MAGNEDRHRFLTAFGLGFCSVGNHPTDQAYLYDNTVWCPQHRPPDKPADPAHVGRCNWGQGHWATAIWLVPRDGNFYCASHLRRILAIGWWKP